MMLPECTKAALETRMTHYAVRNNYIQTRCPDGAADCIVVCKFVKEGSEAADALQCLRTHCYSRIEARLCGAKCRCQNDVGEKLRIDVQSREPGPYSPDAKPIIGAGDCSCSRVFEFADKSGQEAVVDQYIAVG